MKLIETPVNSNLNLASFYPNITQYVFGDKAIKLFKFYSLDRTQIIYADTYDKVTLILVNTKKKITKHEIDVAIKRLLHTTREYVSIDVNVKNEMVAAGFQFSAPRKDIIRIELPLAE